MFFLLCVVVWINSELIYWYHAEGSTSATIDLMFAKEKVCIPYKDSANYMFEKVEGNGTAQLKLHSCGSDSTCASCTDELFDYNVDNYEGGYYKYFSLLPPAEFTTEYAPTLPAAGDYQSFLHVYACGDAEDSLVCNSTGISYGWNSGLATLSTCVCIFGLGMEWQCGTGALEGHGVQASFGCGDTCTGCCPQSDQEVKSTHDGMKCKNAAFIDDCKMYYMCGYDFPETVDPAGAASIVFSLLLLALVVFALL